MVRDSSNGVAVAVDSQPSEEPLPLVSLVLLTWNQAAFVREAVESALDQDYDRLEIVLSDHGSTDGTLEIIEGLSRSYCGPHRLIVNRSASPLGVLGHVFDAIAVSHGQLIVGASGDDISRPDRVSKLTERWRLTGAGVLWSQSEWIDEQSRPLPPPSRRTRRGSMIHDAANYFPSGGVFHLHGATAAYDRGALAAVERPDFPVMSEDFYFSLLLGLRESKFEYLDEPLVRCRRHDASLSTRAGKYTSLAARERAVASYSAGSALLLRFADKVARRAGPNAPRLDRRRLGADIAFHEARAKWEELGLARRLASIRYVRARAQLRWILPRLLGWRFLALFQRLR